VQQLDSICRPSQNAARLHSAPSGTVAHWGGGFLALLMKEIPLTQGKVALVDDEDYERLSGYKWHAKRYHRKSRDAWCAARDLPRPYGGKQHTVRMHSDILPGAKEIDHADGNGLNNQKANIRPATRSQNLHNQRKVSGTSSRFKGVYWVASRQRWKAGIRLPDSHRRLYLGMFSLEEDAAQEYDLAAVKIYGQFALTNKMMGFL